MSDEWWSSEEEKTERFWTNTKKDWWTSESDKKRIFQDKLHKEKLEAQALREKEKHRQALERLDYAQNQKDQGLAQQALLEKETAISLRLLEHGLKPEDLDLEYHDLIRRSDIQLQTMQAELNMKDEIAHREHRRKLDEIYQTAMIEITQESARILDEQNKAIAINQQETVSKLTLERNQHQQTLEKDHLDHQYQMERDNLLSDLKQTEFTHEEIMRIIARLLAKKLGLNENEISEEDLARWAEEFPL